MAYEYESKETRVLKTIDSKRYPETNKDFVRNIRRLNSSVDYMSSYMRIMQKGIDEANKNFIDQIQGFVNDMVVIFAGGEPTGFEIGDLKYILQAIGALFGFSGAPFPINLVDAARHFFESFLKSLVQFTDVIFDSIEAWMMYLIEAVEGNPVIGAPLTALANLIIRISDNAKDGVKNAADALGRAQEAKDFAQSANDLGLEIIDAGNNIIKNPSFERNMYQQVNAPFTEDYFRTGTQSLEMKGNGVDKTYHLLTDGVTPSSVRVNGADVYYAEVYVCANDDNTQVNGGTDAIQFIFEPIGRLGQALTPHVLYLDADASLKGKWTKLSDFITMPDDAVRLKMSLKITNDVLLDDIYYFDDVTVREVTLAKHASDNADEALGMTDDLIAAGNNLIKNPGFESRMFSQSDAEYSNVEAHSGTRSLKMVGNNSSVKRYRFLSDDSKLTYIPASGGDKYYVEFWIKGDPANGQNVNGENAIQFVIEPFNQNNTPLDNQTVDLDATTALSSSGNWTKVSKVLTLPDTTARMRLSMQLSSNVEFDETYYFDDFIVREVTLASDAQDAANNAINYARDTIAAGSNIIKNSGFESGWFAQLGGDYTKDQAHTGERSLRMTRGQKYKLLSDDDRTTYIPAAGSDIYYVEYWVFGKATNNQSNPALNGVKMVFESFDASGQPLTPDKFIGIDAGVALNGKWTKVSGYVDLPEGTSNMRISLQTTNDLSLNETYYFDDIMVREVTLSKEAQDKADIAMDFASSTVESGSNIIVNPSFENGLFAQGGGDYTNLQARTGDRSLRIPRGNKFYLLSDDAVFRYIPATGGDIYYCEFYVMGKSDNSQTSGGTDAIRLVFESFGHNNAQLAEKIISKTSSNALNGVWTKVSGYVVLPDDTVKVRISLQVTTDCKFGDTYYFDDVVVREVTLAKNAQDTADAIADEFISAGTNLVKNPGFEIGWFAQSAGDYTTEQARTGLRSLRIMRTAGSGARVFKLQSDDARFRYVPAAEGDTFQCEVWVRGKSTNSQNTGGANGIQILFEPVDIGNNKLTEQIVSMTASNTLNGKWTKLSGTVKMPPDTAKVRMNLVVTTDVSLGEVYYFDDVMVREVTLADTANTNATLALENADAASTYADDIVTAGSNLIKNSDFERGTSSQITVATFSNDQYYSGTQSLKITSSGAEKTYWLLSEGLSPKTIPAAAGDIYYCEMWVYGKATNTQLLGGANGIRLICRPQTRFGVDLTDAYVAATASTALNGTWTKISAYVTMPANTAKVKFAIQLTSAVANNEIYYFDAVTVREVTVAKGAQTAADTADGKAVAADTKAQNTIDAVVQAVDGSATTGSAPTVAKGKLETVWNNLWDGLNGNSSSSSSGKRFGDLFTIGKAARDRADLGVANAAAADGKAVVADGKAVTADGKAVTADSKAQNTIDAVIQAVDGSGTTGAVPATAKTKLETVWNNLWDGLAGNASSTSSNKRFGDLFTIGKAARDRADLGVSNASTADGKAVVADGKAVTADGKAVTADTKAQATIDAIVQAVDGSATTNSAAATTKTKLESIWNNLWDGLQGNSSSTSSGKRFGDLFTAGKAARDRADLGVTNASTADGKAVVADGKAVTADGKAVTADGKAVAADTKAQATIDAVVQAVDGSATTNSSAATAKTKLETVWNNLWDGLTGNTSSTSTGKRFGDLFTVGKAARDRADLGVSNAATADGKAVVADGKAVTADGKAVSADAKAQNTIDAVVQAVDGSGTINSSTATAKSKLETVWNNLWDGLAGNATSTSTGKRFGDLFTMSKAARTQANLGVTNAATADGKAVVADGKAVTADGKAVTADGKAVTAQGKADTAFTNADTADGKAVLADVQAKYGSAANNIVISPDFEDSTIARYAYVTGNSTTIAYSTTQSLSGTQSLKLTQNVANGYALVKLANNRDGDGTYNGAGKENWVQCREGDLYYIDCNVWLSHASTFYFNFLGKVGASWGTMTGLNWSIATTGSWVRIKDVFTVSGNTYSGLLPIFGFSNATAGSYCYIDSVMVRLATPMDLTYTQTLTTRAVGLGQNPMGTKLSYPMVVKTIYYRCGTADASNNSVFELRKNGSTVSGTSVTVPAASQVAGGSVAGSWTFAAGDILTVYCSTVGTTPGSGLVADISGALLV